VTNVHDVHRAMNRLAKWRSVFAGWQVGTRPKGDPECDAIRDHREATLLLRMEASAVVGLLLTKGLITQEELQQAFLEESDRLDLALAAKFPGFRAVDDGIEIYDVAKAQQTTKGWRP
jgi:hypothetical protein